MNVYNIVWADDEIDDFLDDAYKEELLNLGFNVIKSVHNGEELEEALKEQITVIDAVIVDANFGESKKSVDSEREVSGLDHARHLYRNVVDFTIPFFLYSGRTEELLYDVQSKERPNLLKYFRRHDNWFSKTLGERDELFEAIKAEVEKRNSPSFIIRNRYKEELAAASVFDGVSEFILDFLLRDYTNTLDEMVEPFVQIRRAIEKMFTMCEKLKLIPPISDDLNGTAGYFLRNKYSKKDDTGKWIPIYKMNYDDIMAKPLAQSLSYIVDIIQDASHSKGKLTLKVDEYFHRTSDILLLRSVANILIDCIKWFTITAINHRDLEVNEYTLWKKIEK